jgi:periplasmic mercuric ion binding protein
VDIDVHLCGPLRHLCFPYLIIFSELLADKALFYLGSLFISYLSFNNSLIMKTIKLFLIIVMITSISGTVIAQTTSVNSGNQKTETFKVWGNCNMCKTRIEKAVKSDGAIAADWNVKTKMLTVTFNPSKTSVDSFSKKLASVGHDTEKYKADDKAYGDLDSCCKYDRKN